MSWLVCAHYAFGKVKTITYRAFDEREDAMAWIEEKKADDSCYLAELWQHAGVFHAVG